MKDMSRRTETEDLKWSKRKLWLMEVVLCVPLFLSLIIGAVSLTVIVTESLFTFRGGVLVVGLFSIAGLCSYGIWRLDKAASKASRELRKRTGKVSKLWYLAPLIGIIGGLWAYRELKNTDPELARTLLLVGVVATILYIIQDFIEII